MFKPATNMLPISLISGPNGETPTIVEMFGRLSNIQKAHLGEALDVLLYMNRNPNGLDSKPVSFLQLAQSEKFGFTDDPAMLQRMCSLRVQVMMADEYSGLSDADAWKWYDVEMTAAIYSWVRHNRKYKVGFKYFLSRLSTDNRTCRLAYGMVVLAAHYLPTMA